MRHLQRQRLFENHLVDALAEPDPQEGLTQRDHTCHARDSGDQHAFQRDPLDQPAIQMPAARRASSLRGSDRRQHGVDDARAGIGDAGRQNAGDDGQGHEKHQQAWAGAPDEGQRAPRETERANATGTVEWRNFGRRGTTMTRHDDEP